VIGHFDGFIQMVSDNVLRTTRQYERGGLGCSAPADTNGPDGCWGTLRAGAGLGADSRLGRGDDEL